jgi:hypothetical protein
MAQIKHLHLGHPHLVDGGQEPVNIQRAGEASYPVRGRVRVYIGARCARLYNRYT